MAAVAKHRLTFPPFPEPPPDKRVVPFEEFTEGGIRVDPGPEDQEIDASGIATTPILSRHKIDVCKTNTKRKHDIEEAKRAKDAGEKQRKKAWWEVWEECNERHKRCGDLGNQPEEERLRIAAASFTKAHIWPPQILTQTGPRYIWDKFLRFIGLPEGGEATIGKKAAKNILNEVEDFGESDSDEDDDMDIGPFTPAPSQLETAPEIARNTPRVIECDDDRIQFFLEDPDMSIRVFMSSYAWRKGLVWAEQNLTIIPRLLGYFIDYLIRSKVLVRGEESLRDASKTAASALVELPNVSAFMKIIPDRFAIGCKEHFGQKAEGYKMVELPKSSKPTPQPEASQVDVPMQGPEPKEMPAKEDQNGGWGGGGGWGDGAVSGGWGNNAGDDPGNTTSGWPSKDDGGNGWTGDSPWADSTKAANIWTDLVAEWVTPVADQPLFALLGPTALPLTHRTGVVERAMRRIKSIAPPAKNPSPLQPSDGPSGIAIEAGWDSHFCKLTLGPMLDWDGGQAPVYSRPLILESSHVEEHGSPAIHKSASKPHDPLHDEITLLMESDRATLLREGMGIGGTFIQLVRRDGQAKKQKKGKSKDTNYWYLEEIAFIAVSYWAFTS